MDNLTPFHQTLKTPVQILIAATHILQFYIISTMDVLQIINNKIASYNINITQQRMNLMEFKIHFYTVFYKNRDPFEFLLQLYKFWSILANIMSLCPEGNFLVCDLIPICIFINTLCRA